MWFELDQNVNGQWIWRLKTSNGRTIADSGESYVSRQDCLHGIQLVKGTDWNTPVRHLPPGVGLLGSLMSPR